MVNKEWLKDKMSSILTYVEEKYGDNGKHKVEIYLIDAKTVCIEIEHSHNHAHWSHSLQSLGEFYNKHINWIKEIPEEHTKFLAEILGQHS